MSDLPTHDLSTTEEMDVCHKGPELTLIVLYICLEIKSRGLWKAGIC